MRMRITYAYDKKTKEVHYKIRHGDIREAEFEELFSGPLVVVGQERRTLKAVGRTLAGRFLTVVFIRVSPEHCHVITAWPSTRRQIVMWHKEMKKR